MRKPLYWTASLAIAAMLFTGCSKSKSSSTETSSEDYGYVSSPSGEHNGGSDYSSDESYSTSSGTYSSEESYSEVISDRDQDGSTNWDEFLKSYDEFADKYIAFLKKVQKGDVSAISEYAEYMEKAQNFASKIDTASGDLTASQIAKFNRIQQKILKAASSVKIDQSKLDAAEKALESVSSAMSSFDDDNETDADDDDDDDDDW